jgi:hypothetical protein
LEIELANKKIYLSNCEAEQLKITLKRAEQSLEKYVQVKQRGDVRGREERKADRRGTLEVQGVKGWNIAKWRSFMQWEKLLPQRLHLASSHRMMINPCSGGISLPKRLI